MYQQYEISGLLAWTAWPAVAAAAIYIGVQGRWSKGRTLGALVLCTYALWIASEAFFPMPFGVSERSWDWWSFNPVPLRSLIDSFRHASLHTLVRVHGGNFLLLVPFTLLGPVLWPGLRRWWKALLLGLGLSAAIELTQLALGLAIGSSYRSVDVDDVILNGAGAMLGYGLYAVGHAIPRRARDQSPLGVT